MTYSPNFLALVARFGLTEADLPPDPQSIRGHWLTDTMVREDARLGVGDGWLALMVVDDAILLKTPDRAEKRGLRGRVLFYAPRPASYLPSNPPEK